MSPVIQPIIGVQPPFGIAASRPPADGADAPVLAIGGGRRIARWGPVGVVRSISGRDKIRVGGVLSPPEHPVVDRLAEMPGLDPLAPIQVGNRAGDGENAIADIGVQAQFGDRRFEQIAAVLIQFQ